MSTRTYLQWAKNTVDTLGKGYADDARYSQDYQAVAAAAKDIYAKLRLSSAFIKAVDYALLEIVD